MQSYSISRSSAILILLLPIIDQFVKLVELHRLRYLEVVLRVLPADSIFLDVDLQPLRTKEGRQEIGVFRARQHRVGFDRVHWVDVANFFLLSQTGPKES